MEFIHRAPLAGARPYTIRYFLLLLLGKCITALGASPCVPEHTERLQATHYISTDKNQWNAHIALPRLGQGPTRHVIFLCFYWVKCISALGASPCVPEHMETIQAAYCNLTNKSQWNSHMVLPCLGHKPTRHVIFFCFYQVKCITALGASLRSWT